MKIILSHSSYLPTTGGNAPGRSQVLKDALPVVAEHHVEGAWHGIRPEEIMIAICWVKGEQLIYQITGKCILLMNQIENILL